MSYLHKIIIRPRHPHLFNSKNVIQPKIMPVHIYISHNAHLIVFTGILFLLTLNFPKVYLLTRVCINCANNIYLLPSNRNHLIVGTFTIIKNPSCPLGHQNPYDIVVNCTASLSPKSKMAGSNPLSEEQKFVAFYAVLKTKNDWN